MTGVPRFFGLDEQGREILSYLPGETVNFEYVPDEIICGMARLLRKLHDASVGYLPTAIENGWENIYFPVENHEIICHGDTNTWNFLIVDGKIAGIIDFDCAYPGTRTWDLTSALFSSTLPAYYNYEPLKYEADTRRRIKLFFDAYGMDCPADIISLTAEMIQTNMIDSTIKEAEAGDEGCIKAVENGDMIHYEKWVAFLKSHIYDWI